MTITEILDNFGKQHLLSQSPYPSSAQIATNIKRINEICNEKYSNKNTSYDSATLNRKILLDKEIAALLTPEVIQYLFTNKPTQAEQIERKIGSKVSVINLRDAIYDGFANGLMSICYMPNDEEKESLSLYEKQKEDYAQNTLAIVENIKKATGVSEVDEKKMDDVSLTVQFDKITKEIQRLKVANETVMVSPNRNQGKKQKQQNHLQDGWRVLCQNLNFNPNEQLTLDSFCETILQNPNVLFKKEVVDLLLQSSQLEAALEDDRKIPIGKEKCTWEDIFKKMLEKISANPEAYPPSTKEQLYLRFNLVEADLRDRFRSFEETNLTQGPLPKSVYTYQLEILTKKLMTMADFKIKSTDSGDTVMEFKDGDSYNLTEIIKFANLEHIKLKPMIMIFIMLIKKTPSINFI